MRPLARRRAQGIAEFSLVVPVFFMVISGFTMIALWMINGLVLEGSLREAGRYASDQFSRQYLYKLAEHPIIWTAGPAPLSSNCGNLTISPNEIWSKLPNPLASPRATYAPIYREQFAARNLLWEEGCRLAAARQYAYRMGWDWGIFDGDNDTPDSARLLAKAADLAGAHLAKRLKIFGGIPSGTTAKLCLITTLPGSRWDPSKSYCDEASAVPWSVSWTINRNRTMTQTANRKVSTDLSDPLAPNVVNTPAPRFVRIEVSLPLVRLSAIPILGEALGADRKLKYDVVVTERLLRIEPSCPLPTNRVEALTTGCGVVQAIPS